MVFVIVFGWNHNIYKTNQRIQNAKVRTWPNFRVLIIWFFFSLSNLKCLYEIETSNYKYEPSIWWDELRFMIYSFLDYNWKGFFFKLGFCHPSIIFQNKPHLHEIEGSNWLLACPMMVI